MNSIGVYYALNKRCLIERLAGVELHNEVGGHGARSQFSYEFNGCLLRTQ